MRWKRQLTLAVFWAAIGTLAISGFAATTPSAVFLGQSAAAAPAGAAGGAGGAAGGAVHAASNMDLVFKVFDYLVLSLLGLASIAGIALAIDAMQKIREAKVAPPETTEHLRSLIANREYKQLMEFTATDTSFVSRALYAAIRRAHLKFPAMREALDSSIDEQTSDLFRRIEPMNVIGNIGPLLGLLGTVLGMIMAFDQLRAKGGNASTEDLSGGIATALWHTFFGLFVAIPCLVVYGFYRTRADKIAARAAIVAEELLEGLRPESTEDAAGAKKKIRIARETLNASAASHAPIPQPQAAPEEQPA